MRRNARPACVLVAVVFSLVLKPSTSAAQVSFVMAGHIATSALEATVDPVRPDATAAVQPPAPDADATRDEFALIAERAVEEAGRYVGTRYRWGGDSPRRGFDCSGFVRFVYAQQGIALPRVSRAQARAGRPVPPRLEELRPGDLLFFAQRGPTIDHVAIYAGDGRIVHASRSGYGVRYDDLSGANGRGYTRRLVAARRVIDEPEPLEVVPADAAGSNPTEAPLGEPIEVLVAEQAASDASTAAL